ncbi:lipid-A-disaccharide synthase [Hyphomonas neptunium ATCC 15444]|uniref:Lipid-A-disaccharide synthase n=2 Tax=Hyphomonas TaxID=85 RepID=Q0C1A8_HYPNA|nr:MULTISPECIES: lipid-A-disaccharide synthase [Hyphomonas]ABI78685.1 lipid-A-disaccharide synthase [Hyphomonas neptunium ATCC 15444]KCZ95102.1 lipid-A-disaccharide synthase [Hyphomonas hirschiana VP5]
MSVADIYFVAAEASGDLLAREVIEEIRRLHPTLTLRGIGGAELESIGIHSPVDISPLSILGLFEGIRAYGDVVRLADEAADHIVSANPKVVVLVDSWGFMLRLAQRIRAKAPHIRLVKLIGPQVWATRSGRAKTLAATVDHLLCMHDIEVPYYEPYGLRTTVIGNPALFRGGQGDREGFRQRHSLKATDIALLILPGSRRSEISKVAPALIEAAVIAKRAAPSIRLFIQPAENVADVFRQTFPEVAAEFELLSEGRERFDAMAGVDIVLACSGTVTSEVAMQGTPMIVAYKTGWITWALARGLLYKKTHITLLNILNDDAEIVPEFVQTRQQPTLIAEKALHWISEPDALKNQRAIQAVALKQLIKTEAPTATRAAGAIIDELKSVKTSG